MHYIVFCQQSGCKCTTDAIVPNALYNDQTAKQVVRVAMFAPMWASFLRPATSNAHMESYFNVLKCSVMNCEPQVSPAEFVFRLITDAREQSTNLATDLSRKTKTYRGPLCTDDAQEKWRKRRRLPKNLPYVQYNILLVFSYH